MISNLETMRELYRLFGAGDVPAVLASFAPDISWTEAEGGPYGGVYTGPDAVLENIFMKLGADWDGFTVSPNEFVSDGATIVALGGYSGTFKATGKSFNSDFAHVWKLEGGKVASFHQYADTAMFLRAME